ncbi:enoyl-CoA hydratase/isomerase family protein [Belliella sp. R4-6]|uniref:Enoyl-CoA hydratase/isomerase family protein n=1 Tax=Belliella alkalica TaxID=1730871 RepID=A0ABS9V9F9_9BACT|nr:enoyl-CoA hydratase/isomerase family protein [Belliella alkalica]MCH7412869.1 enoyl-CoA hydratase/isomerase family protein [Belliella alkalica]
MVKEPVYSFVQERIGYLVLNRPEKRNALNEEMVEAMKSILTDFTNNDNVKIIVIKAMGKVFCSGADLESLQDMQSNTYDENLEDSRRLKDLFYQIYTCRKIIIGQVQGHALAGGCGLATVCDFVFSVPHAKFGYTEVKIGFIPAIVKVFLLRKIGEGKAKQLLLDADPVSAEEAKDLGLINWIVEESNLGKKVFDYAQKLATQNSGTAMGLTKEMIGRVQEKSLEEGLEYAASMNAKARNSLDCKKGIAAFLNKESLSW